MRIALAFFLFALAIPSLQAGNANTGLARLPKSSGISCPKRLLKKFTVPLPGRTGDPEDVEVHESHSTNLLDPTGRYVVVYAGDESYIWDSNLNESIKVSSLGENNGPHPVVVGFIPGTRSCILKENWWNGVSVTGSRLMRVDLDTGHRTILVNKFPFNTSHAAVFSGDQSKALFVLDESSPHVKAAVVDFKTNETRNVTLKWPRGAEKRLFWPLLSNDGNTLATRENGNWTGIIWDISQSTTSSGKRFEGRLIKMSDSGRWIVADLGNGRFHLYSFDGHKILQSSIDGTDLLSEMDKQVAPSRQGIREGDGVKLLDAKFSVDERYFAVSGEIHYPSESFEARFFPGGSLYFPSDFNQQWVFARWDLQEGPEAKPQIFISPVPGTSERGTLDFAIWESGEIVVAGTNDSSLFIWLANSNQVGGARRRVDNLDLIERVPLQFSRDGSKLAVLAQNRVHHLDIKALFTRNLPQTNRLVGLPAPE